MDIKDIGVLGEKIACEYLVDKGYEILGRNFWTNIGEIDIIARKKGLFADATIHFVEVKSLAKTAGDFFPEQRVDFRKQRKLKNLAEIWLNQNKFDEGLPYQIDIMAVFIDQQKIDFFENVVKEV